MIASCSYPAYWELAIEVFQILIIEVFAFYKWWSPVGLMPESKYNWGTKVEQIKGDDEDAEISDDE